MFENYETARITRTKICRLYLKSPWTRFKKLKRKLSYRSSKKFNAPDSGFNEKASTLGTPNFRRFAAKILTPESKIQINVTLVVFYF